jgi:hypothetical protein
MGYGVDRTRGVVLVDGPDPAERVIAANDRAAIRIGISGKRRRHRTPRRRPERERDAGQLRSD